MKKFMAFAIALLFLTVMASAVFAAETTFKGEYQVRAWSEWNFDKQPGYVPGDADAQYDGWFDQRFRLTITHTRSEFLKAVIRMDLVEIPGGRDMPTGSITRPATTSTGRTSSLRCPRSGPSPSASSP